VLKYFILFAVAASLIGFGTAHADTIITISLLNDPVIYLNENRMIRADIWILGYDPADGYYIMEVIHNETGTQMGYSEINPKIRSDDLWTSSIAFIVTDEKLMVGGEKLLGEFELKISQQIGSVTESVFFEVYENEWSKPTPVVQEEPVEIEEVVVVENTTENTVVIENTTENTVEESDSTLPGWIKEVFIWYGEGKVSEATLLNAIKFLITEGIIQLE